MFSGLRLGRSTGPLLPRPLARRGPADPYVTVARGWHNVMPCHDIRANGTRAIPLFARPQRKASAGVVRHEAAHAGLR